MCVCKAWCDMGFKSHFPQSHVKIGLFFGKWERCHKIKNFYKKLFIFTSSGICITCIRYTREKNVIRIMFIILLGMHKKIHPFIPKIHPKTQMSFSFVPLSIWIKNSKSVMYSNSCHSIFILQCAPTNVPMRVYV